MILFINFCGCHWLIPWLLPFLLGLLLGWLIWGRLKDRISELEQEGDILRGKIKGLEADLNACRSARAELDSEIALLHGRIKEGSLGVADLSDASGLADIDNDGEAEIIVDAGEGVDIDGDGDVDVIVEAGQGVDVDGDGDVDLVGAKAGTQGLGFVSSGVRSDKFAALKEDNLQVVEGIGPKMNEVLTNAGISTWAHLAAQTPAQLRGILDEANAKRYRIIDPTTWPDQANLANNGSWDELIVLQKNLDTGRASGATGQTDSKVEKMLVKLGVLKRWKQDDLTAIEGIGPKISGLLKDAGINTWRELANSKVERIQSILDEAGKRFQLADPGSWPKQAEMAADGRWDDLEEYQDFLQGGK